MRTPVPQGLAQGPARAVCEAVSMEKLRGEKDSRVKKEKEREERVRDGKESDKEKKQRGEGQRD